MSGNDGALGVTAFKARFAHMPTEAMLFPTQRHLFAHIDRHPTVTLADDPIREDCSRSNEQLCSGMPIVVSAVGRCSRLLPFAMEFPSEAQLLSHVKGLSGPREPSADGRRFQLSKRSRQERESQESQDASELGGMHASVAPAPPNKAEFCVLYGERSLSLQTRLFAAFTPRALLSFVKETPMTQQHVYELIREKAPCHLYFDVERESDYVPEFCSEASHSSDGAGSSMEPPPNSTPSTKVWEQDEYDVALGRATWRPPQSCPLTCPVRADNSRTSEVLLSELERFISSRFPELGVTKDLRDDADVILVLLSRDASRRNNSPSKFSQHYVIKLHERWFADNQEVGYVVDQFVDYLYDRAANDPVVHANLFSHDSPKSYRVLPLDPASTLPSTEDSHALPFLPLKCVIDVSVYSRNRCMRCMGSCKLGKSAVLTVDQVFGRRRMLVESSFEELFLSSLVTWSDDNNVDDSTGDDDHETRAEKQQIIRVQPEMLEVPGPGDAWLSSGVFERHAHATSTCTSVSGDDGNYGALVDYINTHVLSTFPAADGSARGGYVSRITERSTDDAKRYLLLSVEGTRFCFHIGRQHRSNHIYLVIDRELRTWTQKCFDPDCRNYRSPPHDIPHHLITNLEVLQQAKQLRSSSSQTETPNAPEVQTPSESSPKQPQDRRFYRRTMMFL